MKKITLIIAALNEGNEPLKTIESIYATADPKLFEIILFNDGSTKWVEIPKKYKEVTVIHNDMRRGVAWCRDEGVRLAETKYVCILNARMRFVPGWIEKALEYLAKYQKTIFCTTSVVLWEPDEDKKIEADLKDLNAKKERTAEENAILEHAEDAIKKWKEATKGIKALDQIDDQKERRYGADIVEFEYGNDLVINPIWRDPEEGDCYKIPCVLGANYFTSKKWYQYIGGLEGLNWYGGDEEFLSLKSYAFGGDVRIIKEIEIGNLYRYFKNYPDVITAFFMNKLWYCFLLLSWDRAHKIMCKISHSKKHKNLYPVIQQNFIRDLPKLMALKSAYDKKIANNVEHLIITKNDSK